MSSYLEDALLYAARGWSVIPIKHLSEGGKEPACAWMRFQRQAPDEGILRRLFARADLDGLAVITGMVSGNLCCRDFDDLESYERWAADPPDLAATLPTVETARGRHVYFRDGLGRIIKLPDGELRGAGYCLLPPSRHPSNHIYRWLIPLPDGPLPEIDPFAVGLALGTEKAEQAEQTEQTDAIRGRDDCSAVSVLSVPLCPNIASREIEEAIDATIPQHERQRNGKIFDFARRLKAIPALADADARDLRPLVQRWHRRALATIGTKDLDATLFDFYYCWPRIRFPKGTGPMAQALARADASSMPAEAAHYESPEARRLVKVCRALADDEGRFYLGCRTAGELLQIPRMGAWRLLYMLQVDGILSLEKPGAQGRAARYRYTVGTPSPRGDERSREA